MRETQAASERILLPGSRDDMLSHGKEIRTLEIIKQSDRGSAASLARVHSGVIRRLFEDK